MECIKTQAIIIRSIKWSDSSKILTCLTKDYGKRSFIARSAMKTKSKFLGIVDVLQQVELFVNYKENRDLNYIKDIDLIENHLHLSEQYKTYYTALSIVEITDKFTFSSDFSKELFFIIKQILKCFHTIRHPESFLVKFLLEFIHISGFTIEYNDILKLNTSSTQNMIRCLKAISDHPFEKLDRISINPILQKEINHFLLNSLSYHFDHYPNIQSLSFLN